MKKAIEENGKQTSGVSADTPSHQNDEMEVYQGPPEPNFEPVRMGGKGELIIPDRTAKKLSGSECGAAASELIHNITQYSETSQRVEEDGLRAINASIALISEIGPNDVVEGMLASQMVAVHQALIRHSRKLLVATSYEGQKLHETALNKFARTFATQTEALRKHRNGGEQVMRVERVTVNEGGQAVVGTVNAGKGSHKDGD